MQCIKLSVPASALAALPVQYSSLQLIQAMLYSTTTVQQIENARRLPEGAGRGVTPSLGQPPLLLPSSRHTSRPANQKVSCVSNCEAFIISIAGIEMDWRVHWQSLAKIEMGWKIPSFSKIEMGWKIQSAA